MQTNTYLLDKAIRALERRNALRYTRFAAAECSTQVLYGAKQEPQCTRSSHRIYILQGDAGVSIMGQNSQWWERMNIASVAHAKPTTRGNVHLFSLPSGHRGHRRWSGETSTGVVKLPSGHRVSDLHHLQRLFCDFSSTMK